MARVLALLYEACLVVLAALLGRIISDRVDIIPRSLIHLPEIVYSDADFRTTVIALAVINTMVFFAGTFIAGRNLFSDARRTSFEIFSFVLGFTLASIYLFLFTNAIFSPQLLAATGISAVVLFVLSFVVGQRIFGRGRPRSSLGALLQLIGAMFRMLRSPAGIAIVMFALSPLVAAEAFTSSRDFANLVTRVRMAAGPTEEEAKYQLTSLFPGVVFHQPIDIQFPADGSPFIYVLERSGRLWRIGSDGSNKELLIDFENQVGVVEQENGALGLALHPEFGRTGSPNRGYAYIYYTDSTIAGKQTNRLVRFNLDLGNPGERAASETILIEFQRHPGGYHNAGGLSFGPDGFLYVAIGEAEDRANHQRIDRNPFGGIFRIDVDRRGGDISHPIPRQPADGRTDGYFIPNDNPFVGMRDALEEYWALGLRNPFRFSIDPQTGDMWAGDVGSEEWEEVNLVVKGGNYQFPYLEGISPMKREAKPSSVIGQEHGPVYFYHHTARDRAVIGGAVYRGNKLPELQGKYIFADDYSGRILAFPATERQVENVEFLARSVQVAQNGVVKLTNAPNGDFYIVVLGAASEPSGEILKLVRAGTAPAQAIPRESGLAVAAVDGREIFNTNCSRCHGPNGDGKGPDAENLPVKPPDFTSPAYSTKRSLQQVKDIIGNGGAASGLNAAMPPWKDILSTAEIDAAADYVHGLSQQR